MKTRHVVLLALAACAGSRPGATRESRLKDLLDAHHFQAPCEKVWPSALRVAADRGYPLADPDRRLAGVAAAGDAPADAAPTRVDGDIRTAATGHGQDGRRFRVEGDDDAVGCHVVYLPVSGAGEPGDADTAMALALVRKVEPHAADAIEAQASRAPPQRNTGYSPRATY